MTVALPLLGGALVLDDEVIEVLISRLAEDERLADRVGAILARRAAEAGANGGWLRGAEAAAGHAGCPRSRIYDLVAQGKLEHRRDGHILMFRREWIDDAFPGQHRDD